MPSAFSFTYNSTMMMKKVLPSRSPLKKRKHEALLSPPLGSPEPLKKKAVLQKQVASVSVTSVSDDETSPSVAAQALLKLSQAPMTSWVQHFEEASYSSSSEDEENSHSGENQMVKALVRATFDAAASKKIVKKPDAHLQALVAKKSSNNKNVQYHKASDIKAFFEPVNDDKVQAFTLQLVKAVRSNDVTTVRRLHQQGHSMEACNKYGDSIVHLACRRNSEEVLEYLLLNREVSCKLACDYGRTPLHDACWTAQPNYNIIGMLLDACPDLLYIKDARGSTALEYLKKDHWQDMNRFLEQRPVAGLIARNL